MGSQTPRLNDLTLTFLACKGVWWLNCTWNVFHRSHQVDRVQSAKNILWLFLIIAAPILIQFVSWPIDHVPPVNQLLRGSRLIVSMIKCFHANKSFFNHFQSSVWGLDDGGRGSGRLVFSAVLQKRYGRKRRKWPHQMWGYSQWRLETLFRPIHLLLEVLVLKC